MPATQSLVLGTAFHYQVKDVRPFVESLRRHYGGPVWLLVSSRVAALVDYLKSHSIVPVIFDCPYWMRVHVQLGRYVRYGELLRMADQTYDRILLSDVSDVAFQADPFAGAPAGELLCFLEAEGRFIGHCPSNSLWVEQVFGKAVLAGLKDMPIACSGTTIGTHAAIQEYIELLLRQANPNVMDKYMSVRGHDQGIHNYLLHTGALPRAQLIPNGQHVFTLGFVPDEQIVIAPDGSILDCDGRKPAIIHQYNYNSRLLQHVGSMYPAG